MRKILKLLASAYILAAAQAEAASFQLLDAQSALFQNPVVTLKADSGYQTPDPRLTCSRTGPSMEYTTYDGSVSTFAANTCAYPFYAGLPPGLIGWIIQGPRTNYAINNVFGGVVAGSPLLLLLTDLLGQSMQ
jgi:hypothetical protein